MFYIISDFSIHDNRMQGNSPNLCRDVVLYMPVWRAEWDWEHEVPPLVSEAEFLASLIARMGPTHYDEPYTWTPSLTSWGNTTLNQFGRVPAIVTLQRGESCYTDVKWESYLNLPFLALDYEFVCPRKCLCECHTIPRAKL
ncbi:hypothetical protein B0H11DRAFT_2255626 [Mycena galericulata]|nr:hypothetical protein B0H11DRAFT_2255626 [Mycena galericulata]